MNIFKLLTIGSIMAVAQIGFAAESADEGLPSPYFVDELHCSGINVPNVRENWFLSQDEVEPAKKVTEDELCRRLFYIYGIEKYGWLSPDDLERTATLIRQSGYFQEVELSIKRSELKNHVHVYLTVKPGPRWSENLADEFRLYGGKDQGSSRMYDSLTFEVTDNRFSPVTTNSFGIHLMGTSATSPINADPTSVTPNDYQKLQQTDAYMADLYWKNSDQLSKHFFYDLGTHLTSDQNYSNGQSMLNFYVEGDVKLAKEVNLVKGTVYIGPAFIFTTYTPYEVPANNNTRGAFLPGFIFGYDYGHALGNFAKFKIGYYESSKDQSVFQMNFDFLKRISWINMDLIFGFDDRDVRNAVLAQDRFPLSGTENDNVYIGLSKSFRVNGSENRLGAVFGSQEISYSTSSPSYSMNSNYVGLKYKLLDGTWNVDLAASYYFQRTY